MTTKENTQKTFVNSMVRGIYDLQKMRIQCGNRVAANFKEKLKEAMDLTAMGKTEKTKMFDNILDQLMKDYNRITDSIVVQAYDKEGNSKLPKKKDFHAEGFISDYNELILVDQYVRLIKTEEQSFKQLETVLKQFRIYTEFLELQSGVGPTMAGVIMSEIDIHKANYVSSLWRYAGLDVVAVGIYVDKDGKEQRINTEEYAALQMQQGDTEAPMYYKGCLVTGESHVGASRKAEALVTVEYQDADGNMQLRKSITYNPFLRTKLIGVLGGSFLKSGKTFVDGEVMGAAKRLALAEKEGFTKAFIREGETNFEAADAFLIKQGHTFNIVRSKYGQSYYDYKNRLANHPQHRNKTLQHRHNMAIRYAVKRFLVDLYVAWRTIEGLPVAPEYSVAKLGMVHGDPGKYAQ